MNAETGFVEALLAFGKGDLQRALAIGEKTAAEYPEPLTLAGVAHLRRVVAHGSLDVYASPEGFAAFIAGGGNVPLYQATSAAYAHALRGQPQLPALDLGTGDGRALLPALDGVAVQVIAIEPSTALAGELRARVGRRGPDVRVVEATAQALTRDPEFAGARFGLCAATFALQSLPRADRMLILAWIRDHCDRLALAEFDAPDVSAPISEPTARAIVDRYRNGVAEYPDHADPTVSGFLMPVLFGYFAAGRARANWEQPLVDWIADLRAAGFHHVRARSLYPYWWAEAFWIEADAR